MSVSSPAQTFLRLEAAARVSLVPAATLRSWALRGAITIERAPESRDAFMLFTEAAAARLIRELLPLGEPNLERARALARRAVKRWLADGADADESAYCGGLMLRATAKGLAPTFVYWSPFRFGALFADHPGRARSVKSFDVTDGAFLFLPYAPLLDDMAAQVSDMLDYGPAPSVVTV